VKNMTVGRVRTVFLSQSARTLQVRALERPCPEQRGSAAGRFDPHLGHRGGPVTQPRADQGVDGTDEVIDYQRAKVVGSLPERIVTGPDCPPVDVLLEARAPPA